MAFRAALVDRARIVERASAGVRVEGRTQFGEVVGPWFRARLELPATSEQANVPTGVRPVLTEPTLMYDLTDAEGDAVVLTNQKRVEVDSVQLGNELWELTGDPQPLRRKRGLIGYQAPLRRLAVHEREVA